MAAEAVVTEVMTYVQFIYCNMDYSREYGDGACHRNVVV